MVLEVVVAAQTTIADWSGTADRWSGDGRSQQHQQWGVVKPPDRRPTIGPVFTPAVLRTGDLRASSSSLVFYLIATFRDSHLAEWMSVSGLLHSCLWLGVHEVWTFPPWGARQWRQSQTVETLTASQDTKTTVIWFIFWEIYGSYYNTGYSFCLLEHKCCAFVCFFVCLFFNLFFFIEFNRGQLLSAHQSMVLYYNSSGVSIVYWEKSFIIKSLNTLN